MKQKTAKTVREFLSWIDTTPHYYAAASPGVRMMLRGEGGKMYVSSDILNSAGGMFEPGDREFLFMVTELGRKALDTPE